MTEVDKQELQRLAGIPHLPTDLTYELRLAVSGDGPRAYDWSDKPHRLLRDACGALERAEERLRKAVLAEREACAQVCDALADQDTITNYYRVAARAIRARGGE